MQSLERPSEDDKNSSFIQRLWHRLFGFEELFQMLCVQNKIDQEDPISLQIIALTIEATQLIPPQSTSKDTLTPDAIDRIEIIFLSLRRLLSGYYPEVLTTPDENLISLGKRSKGKMDLVFGELEKISPQTPIDFLRVDFENLLGVHAKVEKHSFD